MNWQRDIEVLTPLFNRGAYQDTPEIRVPSIRGMVRWWFRVLGGTPDEEKDAFGGMKGFGNRLKNEVRASRLVFQVRDVQAQPAPKPGLPTLPHKQGGEASPQAAFEPGARFRLEVFSRFGPLDPVLQRKVENALEVWLLLGALGLRANRGGGNVWPADASAPKGVDDLKRRLAEVRFPWPVMIAGLDAGTDLPMLRKAMTDTVKGRPDLFGQAFGGRKASPVKFKVVRLESKLRLLVTAPTRSMLKEAGEALRGKPSHPESWMDLYSPDGRTSA